MIARPDRTAARKRSEKLALREPSAHVRQKEDRRRSDILDAAAAVFAERGYFNTSMKDIADRLGMQPGSVYHYYPSK